MTQTDPGRAPDVRMFVFDDDPVEHMMFRSIILKTFAKITLIFAQTDDELRRRLPGAEADILLCDNHAPPFFDYTESVPAIRGAGYAGPIVVMSSLADAAALRAACMSEVAEICDKAQIDAAFLDELLARHASPSDREE